MTAMWLCKFWTQRQGPLITDPLMIVQRRRRRAIVVGAGPVGCLSALMMQKRGWHVVVYERRADPRLPATKVLSAQRSINLAISHRGIAAIHAIHPEAAQRFIESVIPMRGRMIHHQSGKQESQSYDKDGQCINSIDRAILNQALLDEVTATESIRLEFEHKVQGIDFEGKEMRVRNLVNGEEVTAGFDLCIGADGSYSVVRREMMKAVRMDYHQEYLQDEYLELRIPAGQGLNGESRFLLDPNHLHIWPRHSFMLIALPNKDKSFTCTLFAPASHLDSLDTPESALRWFSHFFPDAFDLIGEKALVHDFTHNPRSPLICTKSKPYHYKDRAIILGDAAHSMVPFYGQGLNCGLEDVRILHILLLQESVESVTQHSGIDRPLATALARYSEGRHDDVVAICDLAANNYLEMRHAVTTPLYLIRKLLDNWLYRLSANDKHTLPTLLPQLSQTLFPGGSTGWLPLYNMVTFRPDISYATAKRKAERQTRILAAVGWLILSAVAVMGARRTRIL